jgi:hypothetical protein
MKRNLLVVLISLLGSYGVSAQQTVGLFKKDAGTADGYVLFAPSSFITTYLMDKCGKLVHSWPSSYKPGLSAYLLPDGNLLRTGKANNTVFTAGGNGGIIEKIDWNGNVTWSYIISSSTECQHHDICPLPNGNILAVVWEAKSSADALAVGRDPAKLGTSLWMEKLVELQPTGTNGANIVWEWHVWDHLVQDYDNTKSNYGVVSQHPELVNLNYTIGIPTSADWLHMNSVAYNEKLDQVMVSLHNMSEFWIIDHSTTTAEASSHSGGAHGKGGDLLYRWGNPAVYNRGTPAIQQLYRQHNAHWVEAGSPDSNKILLFNNGLGRPQGNYSTVELIAPPVTASGDYTISGTSAYQPDSAYWKYQAPNPTDFYGMNISGAQQLPGGNFIVCEGPAGRFFEIDGQKNIVWEYNNPVTMTGPISQGSAATQNTVFRCTQYPVDYSGFAGHTLTPGAPIELNPLSYTCSMNSNTAVSSIELSQQQFSVANPFSNSIIVFAGEHVVAADVKLLSLTGAVCEQWHMDLRSGSRNVLHLQSSLAEGMYLLEITANGSRQVMKVVRE